MNYYDINTRLYNIYKDILNRKKGTPDEFAKRYNISRRTLYNIMEEMKIRGADIKFSRINNCFYFNNDFEFKITMLEVSNKK